MPKTIHVKTPLTGRRAPRSFPLVKTGLPGQVTWASVGHQLCIIEEPASRRFEAIHCGGFWGQCRHLYTPYMECLELEVNLYMNWCDILNTTGQKKPSRAACPVALVGNRGSSVIRNQLSRSDGLVVDLGTTTQRHRKVCCMLKSGVIRMLASYWWGCDTRDTICIYIYASLSH